MTPPWPSGRCCCALGWSFWSLQKLSSTTLLCSSTQRCISGRRHPVVMARAAAARSGAATWVERFIGGKQSIRVGGGPPIPFWCKVFENSALGLDLQVDDCDFKDELPVSLSREFFFVYFYFI